LIANSTFIAKVIRNVPHTEKQKAVHHWTPDARHLAFVELSMSSTTDQFFKKRIPLPSISWLYQPFSLKVRLQAYNLTQKDGIGSLIENWHNRNAISVPGPIHGILGIDAASFKPSIVENVDEPCRNGFRIHFMSIQHISSC
jgi:hypothetical protein